MRTSQSIRARDALSRAPKQLGDFGEGLVNYALNRKGFEVACVDHVGADLIAQKGNVRLAVSVKTRKYHEGSRESRMANIQKKHLAALEHFANRFQLSPVFAHVACVVDDAMIHLFMVRMDDVLRHLKETKHGYSLTYSKRALERTTNLPFVDYSRWTNEVIGDSDLSSEFQIK